MGPRKPANAIAEAITRPTMRFVEVRTPEQFDLQALQLIREHLVGQRTALMNRARAFCLEYGLATRVGGGGFHADIRRHLANAENDLPPAMRVLLEELLDDLAYVEGRIKTVNGKVEALPTGRSNIDHHSGADKSYRAECGRSIHFASFKLKH